MQKIGVSNFSLPKLNAVMAKVKVKPAMNQAEARRVTPAQLFISWVVLGGAEWAVFDCGDLGRVNLPQVTGIFEVPVT